MTDVCEPWFYCPKGLSNSFDTCDSCLCVVSCFLVPRHINLSIWTGALARSWFHGSRASRASDPNLDILTFRTPAAPSEVIERLFTVYIQICFRIIAISGEQSEKCRAHLHTYQMLLQRRAACRYCICLFWDRLEVRCFLTHSVHPLMQCPHQVSQHQVSQSTISCIYISRALFRAWSFLSNFLAIVLVWQFVVQCVIWCLSLAVHSQNIHTHTN